jgi:hypothetical protein
MENTPTTPPASKYQLPPEKLPLEVKALYQQSNRPVLDPRFLFFREAKPSFYVPEITTRDKHDSWAVFSLDSTRYYLWQWDKSLAVYAHYPKVGCLYLGCVSPNDWTLG